MRLIHSKVIGCPLAKTLRRRKSSGTYYAFVRRGRKQFRRSLHTTATHKAFARRRLADVCATLTGWQVGEAAHATFNDVAARWLEATRHTLKAGTVRHRQTGLKGIAPFLECDPNYPEQFL